MAQLLFRVVASPALRHAKNQMLLGVSLISKSELLLHGGSGNATRASVDLFDIGHRGADPAARRGKVYKTFHSAFSSMSECYFERLQTGASHGRAQALPKRVQGMDVSCPIRL